jgi:GTPase SAR1 family protein
MKEGINYKLYFLGKLQSGKTSIINRLVNNSFIYHYNTTDEITYIISNNSDYTLRYILNDEVILQNNPDKVDKYETPIYYTLIDMYGLNHPILQTNQKYIKSVSTLNKRNEMVQNFKRILSANINIPADMTAIEVSDEDRYFIREARNQRIAYCFVIDILDEDPKLLENV